MMKEQFNLYSQYYNLLYKDKDYLSEVNYVEGVIKKYSEIEVKSILDLGCGTGRHDIHFANKGYKVTGIDLSDTMLQIAEKDSPHPNCHYLKGDARTLKLHEKFDAIISLFHVASYQTSNEDLKNYFNTAFTHLKPGGIFVFDFWYGPAVLHMKPEYREKVMEDQNLKIKRITRPALKPNINQVEVNFENIIEDKKTGNLNTIKETHNMRYLFLPELEFFLKGEGFSVLSAHEWMTNNDINLNSWNGVMISQK